MDLCFERGDIVISAPAYTARCYCILEVDPGQPKHPYVGVNLVNRKHYRLSEESIIKVGTATPEFLSGEVFAAPGAKAKDPARDWDFQIGQERARFAKDPHAKKRWEILADAKPGDTIQILRACGKHTDDVTFRFVLERGTKFVWVGESGESTALTKFPLDVIAMENKPDLAEIQQNWEARAK